MRPDSNSEPATRKPGRDTECGVLGASVGVRVRRAFRRARSMPITMNRDFGSPGVEPIGRFGN